MDNVIGLVTSLDTPTLTPSDELLRNSFETHNYSIEVVPWDDPTVVWSTYSTLVLRSCWNYHKKVDQFKTWLSDIEKKHIRLYNPYSTIYWNIHKSYLFELEQKGIPIIPTTLIHPKTLIEKIFDETGYSQIVLKPTIGASSSGVQYIHKRSSVHIEQEMLVQPYMNEVPHGELSFIFFGNTYSHAVKNGTTLFQPDQNIIKQVAIVLRCIKEPCLYARVDGLLVDNIFTLMELELIEPRLYFDLYPEGAEMFVQQYMELIS